MNDWSIILLPALPSAALGVAAIVGFTLYVREKLKHKDEQAYQALQEAYEGDMAQLTIAEEELERMTADRDALNQENDKLHVQVTALVDELNVRSHEITILRERTMDTASQLSESQAEIERLNEAAHAAPFVIERGYVDEDTVATNTQQPSAPARASRKRKAPEATADHSH